MHPQTGLLRWAGSKREQLSHLLKLLPDRYGTYIEPFAGSAVLFFELGPAKAILGDINPHLIDAYRNIRRVPKIVHRLASEFSTIESEYYRIRSTTPESLTGPERTARFVYLNRYCFNGVYRVNRKGEFNVPRGRNTGGMPSLDRFITCARQLRAARLECADFETILGQARRGDFVYLDPPYTSSCRHQYGEYGYDTFRSPDLQRLMQCLQQLDRRGVRFLLSYGDSGHLRRMCAVWSVSRISVRRHVAGFGRARRNVRELIICNYDQCS